MSAPRRRSGATRRQILALTLAGAPWLARATEPGHVVRPWPPAKAVPPFDLVDLDGRRWTLQALAGKVVLLNFWATWCEPCRMEMPSLDAASKLHRAAGLVVLAVNYKESAPTIRAFLGRMPYKATILLDAEGDAAAAWTPRVFPSTVLIGRDGRPTATVMGDLDWTGTEALGLVEPLLAATHKG